MFFLLNTARFAYRLGKWRGTLCVIATAVPLALPNSAAKVFSILPGQPQPPVAIQWVEIGFSTPSRSSFGAPTAATAFVETTSTTTTTSRSTTTSEKAGKRAWGMVLCSLQNLPVEATAGFFVAFTHGK